MKYIYALLITSLVGCAHIEQSRSQFDTWQLQRFEMSAYKDAINILQSAVPAKILKECGYKFNAPIAPTIAASYEEIEMLFGSPVNGFYSPKDMTVHYAHGQWKTLRHEYLHYLNDISDGTKPCYDQVIAYLGAYALGHRFAWEGWKKTYKISK